MNFVNKAALIEFPLSNVLLLNQMMLAVLVLPAAKVCLSVNARKETKPIPEVRTTTSRMVAGI